MTVALPLADRFQALADPTRLRIVVLLRLMELSVGELAQVLGQSQPRVSRHLKILADAGVLERRKEGSWVFLTLGEPDRVDPMFALVEAWADPATRSLFASDAARIETIRSERAESATRPRHSAHSTMCAWTRSNCASRSWPLTKLEMVSSARHSMGAHARIAAIHSVVRDY